jgi:hypothetical protein
LRNSLRRALNARLSSRRLARSSRGVRHLRHLVAILLVKPLQLALNWRELTVRNLLWLRALGGENSNSARGLAAVVSPSGGAGISSSRKKPSSAAGFVAGAGVMIGAGA